MVITRRNLFSASVGAAAAVGIGGSARAQGSPKTFVLVHGAWCGGWCWDRVAQRLSAQGHRVIAPALSGLGERSHLDHASIDLSTHINDVVGEFRFKDLTEVVLVGHSYGGFVIAGAAEQVSEKLAAIIFVDAFLPNDGDSFGGDDPQAVLKMPNAEFFNVNAADRAETDRKLTPQPPGTVTEKIKLTGAYEDVPQKAFVLATDWAMPFKAQSDAARGRVGWRVGEIPAGHMLMLDTPDELTEFLVAA